MKLQTFRMSILGTAVVGVLFLGLSAVPAAAQTPFACNGEAYIIQGSPAKLSLVDQSTVPFTFNDLFTFPAGNELNSLAVRRTDGLIYAWRNTGGTVGLVTIDAADVITDLGRPDWDLDGDGIPASVDGDEADFDGGAAGLNAQTFNTGDISTDGSLYYINLNGVGSLYTIDLTPLDSANPPLVKNVATIAGGTGLVKDFAYSTVDGMLYGGDETDGQLVKVDPVTGARTDFATVPALPSGGVFGGAWFDTGGTLFLYRNNGAIYPVDVVGLTSGAPTTGPGSGLNDGAACTQDIIAAAKEMATTMVGDQYSITYTFENLSGTLDISELSALDDLVAVFGTAGVNWNFVGITSTPVALANPTYNGSSDIQLVQQTPKQSLFAGTSVSITVTIQVTTTALFCNQIEVTGRNTAGVLFGDVSTDGTDPDPNGDGNPSEREQACITTPVELIHFEID